MEFLQLGKEHHTTVMDLEQKLFPDDAWSSASMAAELDASHTYYLGIFDSELIGYAGLSTPVGSFSSDIQTIGIAASGAKGLEFAERAANAGVMRCPDLGKMLNFESPWDGIILMDNLFFLINR
jgi:hypothetical protein